MADHSKIVGGLISQLEYGMDTTPRTSEGLCEALFQEFDLLRAGKVDHHRAAAVSKLAVQIINTKRLEIDAGQFYKSGLRFEPLTLAAQGVKIGTSK